MVADRNQPRAPTMQKQITPQQFLQRAKGLLTSTGKPTQAVQDALQIAEQDASPEVRTRLRAKSLDYGNGTLGDSIKRQFLKAKAKSISRVRSRSRDTRRNRKDNQASHSPPLSSAVSMASAHSASSRSEEQPITLTVPVASGSLQHGAEKSSMADVAVPPLLREGVQMTKVSPRKQKSYKFQLDPDQGQIIWQSKKLRIST